MAFKKAKDYNEERYGDFFMLRNDGDYADVIFLYQSYEDVLMADVHYIKSNEYSGYVQCIENGCPACAKPIKKQSKLFIPLYNIMTGKVEFWDRSTRFENQLIQDVLTNYPTPCDYVFRITRHGAAGSMETTYSIELQGMNKEISYAEILNKFNISMPEYYETICKDFNKFELEKLLTNNSANSTVDNSSIPDYKVTPRVATSSFNQEAPAYASPTPDFESINDGDDEDDGTEIFGTISNDESSDEASKETTSEDEVNF